MLKRSHRSRLIRGCLALFCVAAAVVAALAIFGIFSSDQAAVGSCPLSEMTAASQPACWLPFSATSPFNTPIPANASLAPNNAAVLAHIGSYDWSIDDSNSEFEFTPEVDGTRPVFFATPSDPVMTVHCDNYAGVGSCTGANKVNTDGAKINVPAGAVPYANSDAHFTVIETATGDEYDFWDTSISGSTINAGVGAVVSVSGDGRGSQGDDGQFALLAGLVRPAELASGQIDHALVVTVPCVNATGPTGFVWPAQQGIAYPCSEGGESSVGAPELGQLLRLNMTAAQIQASPAPAWQKTIMTAFATYGAYIEDTDGAETTGINILTQSPASWTDVGQPDAWQVVTQQFGSSNGELVSSVPIPASDLQVVEPCYPEGSCPVASAASVAPTPVAPVPVVAPIKAPASTPSHKSTAKHKKHKAKKHKAKKHKSRHHRHHHAKHHRHHRRRHHRKHRRHKS
jgi:hypothetical protein